MVAPYRGPVAGLLLASCAVQTGSNHAASWGTTPPHHAGSGTSTTEENRSSHKRLQGAHLRAALIGKTHSPAPVTGTTDLPVIATRNVESFGPDGRYSVQSDLGNHYGNYDILDDQFCVQLDGSIENYCRALFVDQFGSYFASSAADANGIRLHRVIIR